MGPIFMASVFSPSKNNQESNLHYQHQPVPGIYFTDTFNHRWLIAIKSNGRQDVHHIFRTRQSSSTKERTISSAWSSNSTLINVKNYEASTTTVTLKEGMKSPTTETPIIDSEASSSASWRTTHIPYNTCSKNKHDSKPLAIENLARRFLPAALIKYLLKKSCHLTLEDSYGGYQHLAEPLEIKWCTILQRWMFFSEIAARTRIVSMCGSEKCLATRHTDGNFARSSCKAKVERAVFVLDDGQTYIIVGDVRESKTYGKEVYQRRGATLWNSAFLYETDCGEMAKLRPNPWCDQRKKLFALNEKEKRVFTDADEMYVDVVEYINAK